MITLSPAFTRESKVERLFLSGHFPFLLVIGLTTYFWWPALWYGQVIVHADAAHHGLSLLSFHAQALLGERELLWDSGVYGGHPLFAEGQGGFANPLNILCALLFDPEYGVGVFHWLSMLLSGAGVYCLTSTLGTRPWAAVFASLATVFSGVWIGFQYNLSVSGALTWAPWLLASVEYWLKRPTLWRASLMALPAALLIFAGYPHIAHGSAIYLVIRLSALLFTQESRMLVWVNRKSFLLFGIWAVVLAVGLSAVQLLPLIELIGQSHRDKGISLAFAGLIDLNVYIKGLLFFNSDPAAKIFTTESLASSLAVLLFGAVIFAKPPARIVGHVLAAIFLLNLGMEFASPLFKMVYESNLVPGLRGYRIMHPFFPLAVIGMAVTAAYVLDNLVDILHRASASKSIFFSVALYCLLWVALVAYLYDSAITWLNLLEPALFLILAGGLCRIERLRHVAALAVILYTTGVLAYKSDVFNFYDTSVLRQPESIQTILKDPQLAEFKASSGREAGMFVFIPSNDPSLGKQYQHYLKSISPFPALDWGVPSIDGVLGLALARRMLIQSSLEAELNGDVATPPGSRLIDVLGIKYASRHAPTNAAGLELIHHDTDDGVLIYRNNHARPRFQLYEHAAFVPSPEAALQQLVQSEPGLLLVEAPEAVGNSKAQACEPDVDRLARLEVSQATSRHYRVTVSTGCPVWLFVADANYPGWHAKIDNVPVALYSAQVMGKAVRVPAGDHHVQLDYVPRSFYVGLSITLVSLVLVFISLLLALRKRYQP